MKQSSKCIDSTSGKKEKRTKKKQQQKLSFCLSVLNDPLSWLLLIVEMSISSTYDRYDCLYVMLIQVGGVAWSSVGWLVVAKPQLAVVISRL